MKSFLPTLLLVSFAWLLVPTAKSQALIQTTGSTQNDTLYVCPGTPLLFSAGSGGNPNSWTWSFSSGNPSTASGQGPHSVDFTGSGLVTLTTNGPGGASTDSLVVIASTPNAAVNIGGGVSQVTFQGQNYHTRCVNTPSAGIILSNNITGVSPFAVTTINWGDGTPNMVLSGPWTTTQKSYFQGNYVLLVTVQDLGCVDTVSYNIFVGTSPSIGFANPGTSSFCLPDSITFPISNYAQNTPGTLYSVSFNDGSPTVTLPHPPPSSYTHHFQSTSCSVVAQTNQGSYSNAFQGTITADNACGSSSVSVAPIYASSRNQVNFNASDTIVCTNGTVQFTDQTVHGIEVTISGCDSLSPLIWTIQPSVGWNVTSGTLGNHFGFVGQNYDASIWTTGSAQLDVQFTQAGVYTVQLMAGNGCGPDSMIQTVCVNPSNQANFSISDTIGCVPFTIQTSNSTPSNICGTDQYLWQVIHSDPVGCGQSGSFSFAQGDSLANSPSITFQNPGLYTLQLINNPILSPADSNRCPADTVTRTFLAKSSPFVQLTPPLPTCQTTMVAIQETVNGCYGVNAPTYQWSMPTAIPSSSTLSNPGTLNFQNIGTHQVVLAATNECGTQSDSATVTIDLPASISAGSDLVSCMNTPISLNGVAGGSATTGQWVSNPAGTFAPFANQLSTNFTPPLGFSGQVQLILTSDDPSGPCPAVSDTLLLTLNLGAQGSIGPIAGICEGDSLFLQGGYGGSATSITWNSSVAGSFLPSPNDTHAVFVPVSGFTGSIQISLTTNDPPGVCGPDTQWANLNVYPIPDAIAPPTPTICSGDSLVMVPGSNFPGVHFQWTVAPNPLVSGAVAGQGDSIVQVLHNLSSVPQTLQYTIVPMNNTCPGNPITVSVTVNPAPFLIPQQDVNLCAQSQASPIGFTAQPSGVVFQWVSSGTLTGIQQTGVGNIPGWTSPAHAGPMVLTDTVMVVPSLNGCAGLADTFLVQVQPTPQITTQPLQQTICSGTSTLPQAWQSTALNASYQWVLVQQSNINPPNLTAGSDTLGSQTITGTNLNQGVAQYTVTPSVGGCPGPAVNYTILVDPLPQISATPAQFQLCSGAATQIQLNSNLPGTQLNWTVSNPNNVNGAMPGAGNQIIQTLQYQGVNPANVQYLVQASYQGCAGTPQMVSVSVQPIPSVSGSPNPIQICSGQAVQAGLSSNVNNTIFQWIPSPNQSITGAVAGSGDSIQDVLHNIGNAMASLTYAVVPTAGNCQGVTYPLPVQVQPVVQVSVNPSTQTICSGQAALATIQGNVQGANYQWIYQSNNPGIQGASSGSGAQFNQTIHNQSGIAQTLMFSATASVQGCPGDTSGFDVLVHPLPQVQAGNNQSWCLLDSATTLSAVSPSGGIWTGPGISVGGLFQAQLAGTGSHYLVYDYTDPQTGCRQADSLLATVHPMPVASSFHDSLACVNGMVLFNNLSSGATQYLWDFGDGNQSQLQAPSHVYNLPGLYQVSLIGISANGCLDTMVQAIRIVTAPVAQYQLAPSSGCAPLQVAFNNQSNGYAATWNWNFGNGMVSIMEQPGSIWFQGSPLADTTYLVQLTVSNLCGAAQYTDSVRVFSQPTALFGTNLSQGCSPLPVQFSQNSIGSPNQFQWDFGDGNLSNQSNPGSHTFIYSGSQDTTYIITLTVSNACGTDVHTDSVRVLPNTIQAFFNTNPTSGCAPLPVQFTNFTNGATQYVWDFGDGNSSSQTSPSHTYGLGGTYQITLAATNGCAYDTATATVSVGYQPQVGFTVQDSLCGGEAFAFTNTSQSLSNTSWDFGDGQSSSLSSPIHSYQQGGSYTVTLIGTHSLGGCQDTFSTQVVVLPKPQADLFLSDTAGCAPLQVQFAETSGTAQFHQWNFGNGNTSVGPLAQHSFATGNYQVTLIASNVYGCADTAQAFLWVFPVPQADFQLPLTHSCSFPIQMAVQNTSQGAQGFSWNFGNGQSSQLNQPQVEYSSPGLYPIQLIASNAFGCSDTLTDSVSVNPEVHADFQLAPNTGCVPFMPQFINLSTSANQYAWNFGNGGSSNDFEPQFVFATPGTYDVSLIASNSISGCADTLIMPQVLQVNPNPIADFAITPGTVSVLEPHVDVIDRSQNATYVFYDMGDGNFFDFPNGGYIYPEVDTGFLNIQQIAVNAFGCTDTAVQPIRFLAATALYVPNAFTPDGDQINPGFRAYGRFVEDYQLEVFTRWGQLVFESDKLDEAWNGTMFNRGSTPCKTDVYVYKLRYRDVLGEPHFLRGHVSLLNNGTE